MISLAAAYWDWSTCIRVDTCMVQVVGIGDNGIGYETGESASFSVWCVELGCFGLMTQAIWYLKENIKYDGIRSFAPEVFTGDYGMKSDVWSFGACLFELARVEPYHGECRVNSPEGISISSFPFKAIAGMSEVFVDFVKKCLVKDVNERWSVSELMDVSSFYAE